MNKKNFIRIINEELKNFDFLGNDELQKEQDNIDLILNEDLQKQFICDSLLNRKSKIKISYIGDARMTGNWNASNKDDADKLTLEYNITIEYQYDATKEPLKFDLNFVGNDIRMSVSGNNDRGDYLTPPSNEYWINSIDWSSIDVMLFSKDGDEIKFIAYEKAPLKIQNLFVREFLENFISTHTDMDVNEKPDNTSITQYC